MLVSILTLLLAGVMFATMDGGSSDEATESDQTDDSADVPPETDPLPETEPDTGASIVEEDGIVTVELGEDETGSLVMVNFIDTEEEAEGHGNFHEARLYLMPEGMEMPTGVGAEFDGASLPEFASLEDLESELDLQLLASWDLGEQHSNYYDTDGLVGTVVDAPTIQTDDPIAYFDIHARLYEGNLSEILQTTAPPTTDEAVVSLWHHTGDTLDARAETLTAYQISVGTSFDGTDEDDSIFTHEPGVVTINGGDGDDRIGLSGTAYGGAGDDQLSERFDGDTPSYLFGGEGNDSITVYSDVSEGHGGNGDDNISNWGTGSVFGGGGDDQLIIYDGGTAYGGTGDDQISIYSGFGFGGDGEDTLEAGNGVPAESNTLTGGSGADVFSVEMLTNGADGGATITDFDPTEEMLEISGADSILDIRIETLAGSGVTTVEVDVQWDGGVGGANSSNTVTFILLGAPEITTDHISLAA